MKNDSYTFLIIPRKKSSVKKITLSGRLLGAFAVSAVIVLAVFSAVTLDYVIIKRDRAEVLSLRELTEAQGNQIATLSEKIGQYEQTLATLHDFDAKIRMLAREVNKKTRVALKPPPRVSSSPLGVGGSIPEDSIGRLRSERLDRDMDRLIEEAAVQEQSFRDLIEFFKKQKSILACTPSIWPVRGWVSSEFGTRRSPFTGHGEFHRGMDIATDPGREVVAPADGIVVFTGIDTNMGRFVHLNHSRGFSTFYGHLLRSVVRKGQILRRGDIIGFIGNSGRSTGPHLHYTVLFNGVPVNPRKYLN